jgi:hypothetical protein
VDATIGKEADEVESGAGSLEFGEKFEQGFILEEITVADGFVDAGDVLVNDASGTEVEVADFGVTHLAFGQADVFAAAAELAHGIGGVEVIVKGGAGEECGVTFFLGSGGSVRADAPTVADDEDEWLLFHGRMRSLEKR